MSSKNAIEDAGGRRKRRPTARCVVTPRSCRTFRYARLVVKESSGRAGYSFSPSSAGRKQAGASKRLEYIPAGGRDGIGAGEERARTGRARPVAEVVPTGDAAGHAQTTVRTQDLARLADTRRLVFVE